MAHLNFYNQTRRLCDYISCSPGGICPRRIAPSPPPAFFLRTRSHTYPLLDSSRHSFILTNSPPIPNAWPNMSRFSPEKGCCISKVLQSRAKSLGLHGRLLIISLKAACAYFSPLSPHLKGVKTTHRSRGPPQANSSQGEEHQYHPVAQASHDRVLVGSIERQGEDEGSSEAQPRKEVGGGRSAWEGEGRRQHGPGS